MTTLFVTRTPMPEEEKPSSQLSYDRLIKAMLRNFYPDLGLWLLGERPLEVKAFDTALPTAAIRFADKLLYFEFKNRPPIIAHFEFQATSDEEMPRRMAQYFTLLLGTLSRPEFEKARFSSFVVYLNRENYKDDPGCIEVHGEFGARIVFSYTVVKLWELDPTPILAMKSPGLCPLVPLMAGNPLDLVLKSQNKIARAPEGLCSNESKRELLTVLGGLSSIVIKDRRLIQGLFSELRIMEDNYFFHLIRQEGEAIGVAKGREEGREEGRAQGRQDEARRAILQVLKMRFADISPDVLSQVETIEELGQLEALLGHAVVCENVETFLELLS